MPTEFTPETAAELETPTTTEAPQDAENVPEPADSKPDTPTFADLGVDGRILAALDDVGYEYPRPSRQPPFPLC